MEGMSENDEFFSEKLDNKSIDLFPELSPSHIIEFHYSGYDYCYQLVGQFFIFNKDRELMDIWLTQNIYSMNDEKRATLIDNLIKISDKV